MSAKQKTSGRRKAVEAHKRQLILDAARQVFQNDGLDGASLRAIAAEAGYTPAALYFHFASKEAIYAEVLQASLVQLEAEINVACGKDQAPARKFLNASLAFFDFYAAHPRDLDLGFYLFRGGMKPRGLGGAHDANLNAALRTALQPIGDAATELGASKSAAEAIVVDIFSHAAGLLLLAHTGRIRIFKVSARARMEAYVTQQLELLQ